MSPRGGGDVGSRKRGTQVLLGCDGAQALICALHVQRTVTLRGAVIGGWVRSGRRRRPGWINAVVNASVQHRRACMTHVQSLSAFCALLPGARLRLSSCRPGCILPCLIWPCPIDSLPSSTPRPKPQLPPEGSREAVAAPVRAAPRRPRHSIRQLYQRHS